MNELDKLKDIKPPVEISDYSFMILIVTIVVVLGTLTAGIYYLVKHLKEKKKQNKRAYYYAKIKKLNFLDSKHTAYTISKYGKFLVEDENQKAILEKINQNLEVYKYTNIPPSLSDESKKLINMFMEVVNV